MSNAAFVLLNHILLPPISGSRPSGGVSSSSEGIPSIGGENIQSNGGMNYESVRRIPKAFYNLMPKGKLQLLDVLINKDGAQTGKVGIYDGAFEKAAVNEHVFILRGQNPDDLDQIYLFYCLLLPETQQKIYRRITGSAQPGLNSQFVRAVDIPIREIAQQQKIARILQTIDRAIEQTEALIDKYQQTKAGMMHDLFTRGIGPDGQLRPPREQAPHLYQQTPIGWIPKEWEARTLRDMARPGIPHIKTGPFGSSLKGEHWVSEGVPVITIGALGEGEFIYDELLFITERYADTLVEYQMKAGEVVFSRVADVGRSVVIESSQEGWVMSSNLMRIHLDSGKANPYYLQSLLSFDSRVKSQIRCKVNSGGRDVANSEVLNSLVFAWPKIEEQAEIVSRASSINSKISKERELLDKLRKEKSGLMHDLLTGKVPVAPDPKAADV